MNVPDVPMACAGVQGAGFRGSLVQGSGFRVQDSGFRMKGSGFGDYDTRSGIKVCGPSVDAAHCSEQGEGCREGLRVEGRGLRCQL